MTPTLQPLTAGYCDDRVAGSVTFVRDPVFPNVPPGRATRPYPAA